MNNQATTAPTRRSPATCFRLSCFAQDRQISRPSPTRPRQVPTSDPRLSAVLSCIFHLRLAQTGECLGIFGPQRTHPLLLHDMDPAHLHKHGPGHIVGRVTTSVMSIVPSSSALLSARPEEL